MAERMLRRGLPRTKGGEAWPPATTIDVPGAAAPAATSTARDLAESTGASPEEAVQSAASGAVGAVATTDAGPAQAAAVHAAADDAVPSAAAPNSASVPLRRGLPRVAGGEPWPPASTAPISSTARDLGEDTGTLREEAVQSAASGALGGAVSEDDAAVAPRVEAAPSAASDLPVAFVATVTDGASLRRGLPRVAGGEPWPPAGTARAVVTAAPVAADAVADTTVQTVDADASLRLADARSVQAAGSGTQVVKAAVFGDLSTPLTVPQTVWNGTAPRHIPAPEKEPSRFRPGWPQAIGGLLGLAALGLLAVSGVFLVRAFLSTSFMQDFLTTYPGEYHVDVAPGFAPWVGWQHFFNMFLMVLIIRSGLRVRTEKRPTAFWTPRGQAKGKISLTLWFHQSLDLLWMLNGVIFVVLLFSTGHWLRLVPTSWEVFPNALSAGLQYVSFDWPTDNGWVNYNSLQQLAYFTTVFIAAPLAAITGFRMSGLWPKKAEKLSKAYPIEWARALHFPTMLYFVAFIIVHVALVFLTGALRNLNHMFASMGSVDGMEYAANWTGFGVFVLAILVIAGAWFAARPLVLAPIARLFGQVSGR
ncbi:cytochrome b/b6 domain-containing protein [uncultured Microbacterium sp.]|uniref:cytochrome b/b6 domain-containing protein n=1 Tax=uncultured Microbacterium sp. TaxID=191216 RepID=UPI00262DF540|nr:cytochrome b/b6 domain-containing protein [uncultured Microbacterium sp.]